MSILGRDVLKMSPAKSMKSTFCSIQELMALVKVWLDRFRIFGLRHDPKWRSARCAYLNEFAMLFFCSFAILVYWWGRIYIELVFFLVYEVIICRS